MFFIASSGLFARSQVKNRLWCKARSFFKPNIYIYTIHTILFIVIPELMLGPSFGLVWWFKFFHDCRWWWCWVIWCVAESKKVNKRPRDSREGVWFMLYGIWLNVSCMGNMGINPGGKIWYIVGVVCFRWVWISYFEKIELIGRICEAKDIVLGFLFIGLQYRESQILMSYWRLQFWASGRVQCSHKNYVLNN